MASEGYWEVGMELLEKHQENLQAWVDALRGRVERTPFARSDLRRFSSPDDILSMVEKEEVPADAILLVVLESQASFNKTVTDMLTDLDHRKSEPPIGG